MLIHALAPVSAPPCHPPPQPGLIHDLNETIETFSVVSLHVKYHKLNDRTYVAQEGMATRPQTVRTSIPIIITLRLALASLSLIFEN